MARRLVSTMHRWDAWACSSPSWPSGQFALQSSPRAARRQSGGQGDNDATLCARGWLAAPGWLLLFERGSRQRCSGRSARQCGARGNSATTPSPRPRRDCAARRANRSSAISSITLAEQDGAPSLRIDVLGQSHRSLRIAPNNVLGLEPRDIAQQLAIRYGEQLIVLARGRCGDRFDSRLCDL